MLRYGRWMGPSKSCRHLMAVAAVGESKADLRTVFERNLLGQHHVAKRRLPFRPKAIRNRPRAVLVQLVHVHLTCGADSIMLAAVSARYFEIVILIILRDLGRR